MSNIPPNISQVSGVTGDILPSQDSGETDEREDVQRFLQYCGNVTAVLKECVKSKLDEWKINPPSIAIVGEPGVGKSTFINTVRGVNAEDEGAAPVGEVQTGILPKAYPHPANPNIILWELPGFGCPGLPVETYLEYINLDMYDIFILIWAGRFTNDARKFAKELDRRQKRYFLACTKFDEVTESDSAVGERTVRDRVQGYSLGRLVYFICGFEHKKFDIENLTQDLLHSLLSIESKPANELQSELDIYKDTPVTIGIVGESGVGKSSFINAVRGLTADDEGGAAVGVTETTKEPTKYKHPSNGNVIFWDLPGIGTREFTKENYLKLIQVERYDAFVIMSIRRFTQDESWFAGEVEQRGRRSFFVRSKFDEVKSSDKSDLQRQLKHDIYVISNHYPDLYDFPKLITDILSGLSSIKKESLILTLGMFSEKQIERKEAVLRSRIPKVQILSALFGINLFLRETELYKKAFGLDDASIRRLARSKGIDTCRLEKVANVFAPTLKASFLPLILRQYASSALTVYKVVSEKLVEKTEIKF